MKKCTRTLMTLLLASALSSTAACGDDDKDTTGDNGGGNNGANETGGNNDGNNGTDNNGGTENNGGNNANAGNNGPVEVPECPTHPLVISEDDYCVLTEGTMTADLTIGPVEGKDWVLDGKVIVGEDVGGEATPDASKKKATLTVLPGTTVYGESSRLSYLVIARGSKIIANGTKTNPIVFTALADEKAPGAWGGLALNGRAKATCGIACPSEGESGFFGGPDDADNSGSLKYVRVEWAGYAFSEGNELNGITFNGVGSGTAVDYIQVHYNADDGIEMFGGAVNVKHVVLVGNGDDNIDWQLGWRGKLQYGVVLKGSAGDSAIEADNTSQDADASPISNGVLANLTVVGNNTTGEPAVLLRRGTKGQIHSLLLSGKGYGSCLNVNPDTHPRLTAGDLVMAGSRIDCATSFANDPTGTDFFTAGTGNEAVTAGTLSGELRDTSLTKPDLRLKDGSTLLTGGSKVAGDSFFDQVDYIGAFNATDNWMEGWTSFPAPTGG